MSQITKQEHLAKLRVFNISFSLAKFIHVISKSQNCHGSKTYNESANVFPIRSEKGFLWPLGQRNMESTGTKKQDLKKM